MFGSARFVVTVTNLLVGLLAISLAVNSGRGELWPRGKADKAVRNLATKIAERLDLSADACQDFYQYVCGRFKQEKGNPKKGQTKADPQEKPTMAFNSTHQSLMLYIRKQAALFNRTCNAKGKYKSLCSLGQDQTGTNLIDNRTMPEVEPLSVRLKFPETIVAHLKTSESADWIDLQAKLGTYRGPPPDIDAPAQKPKDRNIFFNLKTRLGMAKDRDAIVEIGLRSANYSIPSEVEQLGGGEGLFERLSGLSRKLIQLNETMTEEGDFADTNSTIMRLCKLERRMPLIDWRRLIAGFYGRKNLDEGQRVELRQASGVERMYDFLVSYNATPDGPDTLAKWVIYKTAIDNIGPKTDHAKCDELTKSYFSPIFLQEYKKKLEESRAHILAIAESVARAYNGTIERSKWPTADMKEVAMHKVKRMTINVGYSDLAFDPLTLQRLYGNLEMDDSNHTSNLNILNNIFNNTDDRQAKYLNVNFWEPNAYHKLNSNSIVPLTELILMLYNKNWPSYANYGQLGTMIAHEMTHGFDNYGIKYDAEGMEPVDETIWGLKDKKLYDDHVGRLIPLYDNKPVPGTIRRSNGTTTFMENIADSGIVAAYYAYLEQDRRLRKKDRRLPGLKRFSKRQLFWINAAHSLCDKPSDLFNEVMLSDNHSHEKWRVNIPMMLLSEFRQDFNCIRRGNATDGRMDYRLW